MELYSGTEHYKLYHGNMLDLLQVIEPNTIDSIVTDPPYELNFMGKGWDNSGIAFQKDTWKKCLEVLKPGGYLLAFGGSRTYHRIACAIEDAGFEIRDCIMWLYGSGFPKSLNIGLAIDKKNGVESEVVGEWNGWGTALKPSYEPIIVARKPLEGSCTDNVIKYGVGGINIDECRVPAKQGEYDIRHYINEDCFQNTKPKESKFQVEPQPDGRFPANTILTYGDEDKEEVCSGFPDTKGGIAVRHNSGGNTFGGNNKKPPMEDLGYNDSGSAARYFYCAKASRRDRDEGLEGKRLDGIDFILLDGDTEIWKGTATIKGGNKALYDMDTSLKRVIEECEMQNKKGIEWNTILYGRNLIERYLNECKYTTKMGISSTTIYQILNWLVHLNTRENTLDVEKYDEKYISHVESAENGNLLTVTIKEKSELVHDVNNAVLKMQLRIREKESRNEHCTVKPTDLMQYLVRLVTPNGGTVLDPFNGSGSTGKAVMYENKDRNKNYKYIGIELTDEYLPIAKARIEYAINVVEENTKEEDKQKPLFEI